MNQEYYFLVQWQFVGQNEMKSELCETNTVVEDFLAELKTQGEVSYKIFHLSEIEEDELWEYTLEEYCSSWDRGPWNR